MSETGTQVIEVKSHGRQIDNYSKRYFSGIHFLAYNITKFQNVQILQDVENVLRLIFVILSFFFLKKNQLMANIISSEFSIGKPIVHFFILHRPLLINTLNTLEKDK